MLTAKLIDSIAAENLTAAAEYLEEGASPNTVSGDGATAMHIAAGVGVDAVRLMLAYGGDPNVRSVDGSTPLHVAAAWGDRDILRLLLHNGANPTLRDHEGQRAVEVARSEEHASCVDFLKYYTMLVTVGDEEESPMYTSELIDPSQAGPQAGLTLDSPPPGTHHPHPPPPHHPGHYSSDDDEEPANLSGQYCDALSRRLGRLLTDGSAACLDATSPDCPYIGEKQDRGRGSGNRTLLADDTNAYFPYLSDSSDDDLCEGGNSCRCRSNHCCVHNQPAQPNFGVCSETPARYFDDPGSSECCDLRTTYAQNVEMKMKRKYFPDLGGGLPLSNRDREINYQRRLAGDVGERCSPSHLKSVSPQRAKCVHEVGAGCMSPYAVSAMYCSEERPSRSGRKGTHHEPGHCQVDRSSPETLKSSSCSCSHHVRNQSSSPSRRECCVRFRESNSPTCSKCPNLSVKDGVQQRHITQKHACSPQNDETRSTQRSLHSPTRRELRSECCSSQYCSETSHCCSLHQHSPDSRSAHRSVCAGKAPHLSPSRHVLHRSMSDHSKQECCKEGHAVSKSLRKQTTYPPAEKSHSPTCAAARSPVVMRVQNKRSSPPPGVFLHAVHFPFTPPGPNQDQSGFTATSRRGKKISVAGSCSSHSVDSGFCEKLASKQHLGTDVLTVLGYQPQTSGYRTAKQASPMAIVCGGKTIADDKQYKHSLDTVKKVKESESSRQVDSYMKFSGKDLHQRASDRLDSETTVEDDCNIVSSNLRGRNPQPGLSRESKHEHTVPEKGDQMRSRKETTRQEATTAEVSDTSCDSFQTCEEASVKETAHDMTSEHTAQKLQIQSEYPSDSRKHGNVSSQSAKTVASDFVESEGKTICIAQDKGTTMGSLGFSVTQRDDGQHNHNSLRKKDASRTGNLSSNSQKKKRPDFRDVDGGAEQRSLMPTQNGSQRQGHYKAWHPPSIPLPDDSDLLTSDESFLTRTGHQAVKNPALTLQSNSVSRWLQNVPATTPLSQLKDAKQGRNRAMKCVSDESLLSIASSVQEYIYRDKENGIALIERHIPSEFSGSSGRPSLENGLDTEATISYDWSDFSIHSNDASSSSSSFDITAGHTLNSQETFKTRDTNSCDEDCCTKTCSESDHHEEESDENERKDQAREKETKNERKGEKTQQRLEKNTEETNENNSPSQETNITSQGESVGSDKVSISPELASLSNEAIYQSLKDLGEDPGPVLPSTRQTYLLLLASLQSGKRRLGLTSTQPGYSCELSRLLSGSVDMEAMAQAELAMVAQFQTADGRAWREGTVKACFNYLLLDPTVTRNLPLRARSLSDTEAFKVFLSAIFYIGKGKRSRPYCHLYEAISQQKAPKPKVSQKVGRILSIWAAGLGVVSLHCFQNVIPVEAYTREACMVDAMGLVQLTNVKKGDYYGVASTWPATRRRCMGAYLLRKAFQIFLSEGERQICPLDIQRGK